MTDALDRLKSSLAGRYTIERELGAGGMATVYLAEDVKHQRKVAVKVLRPELAAVLGAERFLNEIKITANLSHPHILPLLDSGSAEEQLSDRSPARPSAFLYYIMPYVEGESLRDKLNHEKQLSIDEALKIASEVADALASAHRLGVVHRDIKPENILLREGHAVVADFGIALAVKSAGGERLTETGLSLGTPAYMSPEQVAGDRELDGRSDIYSLACVLYEMLAGEPPFTGPNPQAVLARHVTDPVPPITTVRASVPQTVAAAITKALGKACADRFDSAKAFSDALFAESTESKPEVKSIVVLPFGNLSPDPDNAFFADGLTEELIAELSGIRGLRVISRTSAMQFKDTTKSIPAIAGELNVRYALEGSVRRAGDSVRITAQLIEASTDSHLWAERYTGKLDDVFDLQEQLARKIVEALRVALTPEESRRLAARPVDDFRAYDAWLRARTEVWKFSKEGYERAIQLIHQAQKITGDNALLHAALGYIHTASYEFGISHHPETLQQADIHVSKALEIDPDHGFGLYSKAYVQFKRGDFEGSARLLKSALKRDNSNEPRILLAIVLGTVGKVDEAREVADQAVSLDPLYVFPSFVRALADFLGGQFAAASARFEKILDELSPNDPMMLWWLAQTNAHLGRLDEARELFAEVVATGAVPLAELSELYCRAADSNRQGVTRLLEESHVLVEAAKTDEWFPIIIATCHVLVGDEDAAIEWLDRAVDWGFYNYRFLEEYDPFLKPLHGNPRFEELIAKARRKHEAFDA